MRLLLATVIVLASGAAPNLHQIGSKPAAQKSSLYEAVKIRLEAMPLPRFLAVHPDANASPKEGAELKVLARVECSLQSLAAKETSEPQASATGSHTLPNQDVKPGWNGVVFENRKPLSVTDRSNTMSTSNRTLQKRALTPVRNARR